MKHMSKQALQYVRNTGGGATVEHFAEDFEPVGELLWQRLIDRGWVCVRDGKIFLTEAGEKELAG